MRISKSSEALAPERTALCAFFAEMAAYPPAEVHVEALHAQARSYGKRSFASPYYLLKRATENELRRINAANRSKGGGRSACERRERLCGFDPVEAGFILEICKRLGLKRAPLLSAMAKTAIEAEVALDDRQAKSSEIARRLTEREKKLKTFFEDPPKAIRVAIAVRCDALPQDDARLKGELDLAFSRVCDPG